MRKLNETAQQLVESQISGSQALLDGNMTSASANFTQAYNAGSGVTYLAVVSWVPACTVYKSQDPLHPLGYGNEVWAYNLIYWDYKDCEYRISY